MNASDSFLQESFSIDGVTVINIPDFIEFVLRFGLNVVVIFILVRVFYYPVTKRKDYLFTFLLISSLVFLICFLLANVKLQVGFALGLFAMFGIIRYRTDSIPIKEMTYLFIVIGLSVINALASTKTTIADLLFTNLVIVILVWGMEKLWLLKHEVYKVVIYEKIDLIQPEKYEELVADLHKRTGIKDITRVEMAKIDFQRDICTLLVYYETTGNENLGHVLGPSARHDDDDD
ncbi:MAG TPA: DUF4956 domain-containing protein [Bacteroidales bacterium]|nr:DUF4956 domain-containing protein [Bacteroidales bacterium]